MSKAKKEAGPPVVLEEHGIMDLRKGFHKEDGKALKEFGIGLGKVILGIGSLGLGVITKSAIGGFKGAKASGGYVAAGARGVKEHHQEKHPKGSKEKAKTQSGDTKKSTQAGTPEDS